MHKEIASHYEAARTRASRIFNGKSNFVPFSFHVLDYVTVPPAKSNHLNWNIGLIMSMLNFEANSSLMSELGILCKSRRRIVPGQAIILYPIQQPTRPLSREFQGNVKHPEAALGLVDKLHKGRTRNDQ